MSERQKGRRMSWCLHMTRAMSPMQTSLWAYFSFLPLMMLNSFSAKTCGLQMRSMGMKCLVRPSISRFLSRRAALFFSFSSCFSLYLVWRTTPFLSLRSEGLTGSSSLSGSSSSGMVVSMRKQQAMRRARVEGAKQASAMMLTVRLSVQTLRLQRSMSSLRERWAVLSACLGRQLEMKARICWLILLFWWWVFMRRMSLSTYLQIMLRNSLSSSRICRSRNSIVLTGTRMFFARRIITLPAHFFRRQECRLGPSSSISRITALGIHPSTSGKYLTARARKMRSSPNRSFLRMVSPWTFSNSTLKSSRQRCTSDLQRMGSLGILMVRSSSFLKSALSIAFWFSSSIKVEAKYYNQQVYSRITPALLPPSLFPSPSLTLLLLTRELMMLQQMESRNDGFYLIWLYWAKKYIGARIRSTETISSLKEIQRHYSLEAVESAAQLEGRLTAIRDQKGSQKWPVYVINPEKELGTMKAMLEQEEEGADQLYNYYLNTKNVFIIYSNDWDCSDNPSSKEEDVPRNQRTSRHDNISEGNQAYKPSKLHDNRTEGNKSRPDSSALINKVYRFEDQSSECRNESIIEAPHLKIEELEVLDKMAEVDGLEIWNCKYKRIPHSYVKLKNEEWRDCLSLPILHPAQPRPINQHLILPRLQPLRPSIDKLLPFVSYLKLLDKYFPGFMPVIGSVYEANGLPVVFSKEEGGWNTESNVGVLCYYVVNGDEGNLSTALVEKWAESNSQTLLGKTIKQLSKRQREKKRVKREQDSKALVLFEGDSEGLHIW